MFLKQLEITGFKSFPDKIKLDFPAGITAVVGPNGSGKSNIGDAVRWVMGEQSARNLRGAKMDDIIFAGTQHRNPKGYAEVSMLIDNSNSLLPLDFNEITVTRRLYRSGESEYRINGVACRMKDIHRLFMDTGVGREGYSIIGQGKVDEILSTKSEDRRHLFEEAAGIVKYKSRRHEAFLKLESERKNLERVDDLIEELSTQIEPLSEQAEVAKVYFDLRDQYKIIHVNLFLREVAAAEEQNRKSKEQLVNISKQREEEEAKLAAVKVKVAALREQEEEVEEAYKEANRRIIQQVKDIEQAEGDLRMVDRIAKEVEARKASLVQKESDLKKEESSGVKIEDQLKQAQAELEKQESDYGALEVVLRKQESASEEYQQEIVDHSKQASAKWVEIKQQESNIVTLQEQLEVIDTDELSLALEVQQERHESLTDALEVFVEKETEFTQDLAEAETDYTDLVAEEEALRTNITAVQNELNELSSRHKLLSEMERDYEGYYASVKAVLQRKDRDSVFGKGIHGTAGELISVPQAYETAISVALGGAAQNILTSTEDDAQRAIAFLKSTKAGRATFLPISAMKARNVSHEMDKLLAEPGVIGIASSLVSFDSTYEPVFGYLLGNIFVVENLQRAIELSKKYRQSFRMVTLEGDFISQGGAITGGSQSGNSTNLLSRSRQITELDEEIAVLKQKSKELEGEQKALYAMRQSAENEVANLQRSLQALAIEKNNSQNQLDNCNSKLQEIQKSINDAEAEAEQLSQRLEDTKQNLVKLKDEWEQENQTVEQIQQDQAGNRQLQEDNRKLREEALTQLRNCTVQVSSLTQSLETSKERADKIIEEQDEIKKEIAGLEAELAGLSNFSENPEEAHKAIDALKSQLEELQSGLATIEENSGKIREAIVKAEEGTQEYNETLNRLSRESDRLETRAEHAEEENRRLHNEIWDTYSLTFQSAQEFWEDKFTSSGLREDEKRLKSEIAELGEVNVGAIEAYRMLKERHDFLAGQRDDIIGAEEQLKEVIQELTEHMEQQFDVQFSIIAKHFNDVFREMFGGGQASLALSDPSRVLESGIEITAQPPGKKLQTLSLLSGGERALTAIALLFGILRMKPSPFCVLDEIEAALDDANVNRFAKFLRTYAGNTQFIVITHRKGTMEMADTLYGVTMQEMGVSAMVSVDFSEGELT